MPRPIDPIWRVGLKGGIDRGLLPGRCPFGANGGGGMGAERGTEKQPPLRATALCLLYGCPRVPMHAVFSPAMKAGWCPAAASLPSPGDARRQRGHDIIRPGRGLHFVKCGENQSAVVHPRSIPCFYYRGNAAVCQELSEKNSAGSPRRRQEDDGAATKIKCVYNLDIILPCCVHKTMVEYGHDARSGGTKDARFF